MKLKKYLMEKMEKSLNDVSKILSKQYNVDIKYLKFIGKTEEPQLHKIIWWFNITDKNHHKFKSTIAYNEKTTS